jgi:RND family efflux transporter MFP subunit
MTSVDSLKLSCALIVALSALGLSACSKPAPPEEPVRAVKVLTVGAQSLQSGLEFPAEVRARVESRLGFRVAGKLTQRLVEAGQHVKAGQVLAQLDPQDYRLATDAAKAQVNAAQVNRDLAAADFKRYQELKAQNFISGAELDRREASLKAAQAQLEQAQAQLTGQANQASYTRLLADVSGVVTAVDAEVGQVVAAGTPVLRIAQDGARDLVFAVPEDRVARLKLGSAVLVRPWSGAVAVSAMVREVAASADPVTRTFAVKAALPAGSALALGSTVTVLPNDLARNAAQVIKLPTSALFESAKASAVWVLDPASMSVRLQPVQIASVDGNEVVIASGLQAGMQVVSAGVHVLSPGLKVTLWHEKAALPAAAASAASAPLAK